METYYKVVLRNNEGQLVSPLTSQAWQVQYEPNRWVEAPIGKLFVFSSKTDAIRLSDAIATVLGIPETWVVEAEEAEERFAIALYESDFAQYWAGALPRYWERSKPGTLLAKRVMLVRRVFAA
jgi:hypothetical protein